MDQYISYTKKLSQTDMKSILESAHYYLIRYKQLQSKTNDDITVYTEAGTHTFYTLAIDEKVREHAKYNFSRSSTMIELFNKGMMELVRVEKFFCPMLEAEREEEVYKIKDELIMVISMISL